MSIVSPTATLTERIKYYLDRAEETRTIAELMSDPVAKNSMRHQSQVWQRMADRAAEKLGPNDQ